MHDILRQLVAFHSVDGDTAAERALFDYVQDFLTKRGMHITRETLGGHETLVATTKKDDKAPTVMFVAHLDVVPGEKELFTLQQKDDKLVGRGVFDMKMAAACYLQIVDELQSQLDRYDFGIMFTSDEEQGGADGVNGTNLLLKEGYRPCVAVLPDGGDNWQIEEFAKGAWLFDLHATGRTAHGSRPWEGDNAAERVIDALQEIRELFKDQHQRSDTLSIGILQGGVAHNQIPDSMRAGVDIRTMTQESWAQLRHEIQKISEKYGLTLENVTSIPPVHTDLDSPFVRDFIVSVQTITGQPCEPSMSYGASDSMYFQELGIPCVICRPFGGGQHSSTEWLDIQAFADYKEVLVDYLHRVLNEPVGAVIKTTGTNS
jgi:succinyl-diaminopimelate desuccinylase